MGDVIVRKLTEDDWQLYRSVRLRALEESPEAFVAVLADEVQRDDDYWKARMQRSQRLLAEIDHEVVGIASVGAVHGRDEAAQLFGLWVDPERRGTGAATELVRAGAIVARAQGKRHLLYWVGTENGRAVAFASGFGFRPRSERRPMRVVSEDDGEEEIAMDLPLADRIGNAPRP